MELVIGNHMGLGQLNMSEMSEDPKLPGEPIRQIVASFKNVVLYEENRQPLLSSMSILEESSHPIAIRMPR